MWSVNCEVCSVEYGVQSVDCKVWSVECMSESATAAIEFTLSHDLMQPCQCDSQKTHNTTRLKRYACHAK